MTIHAKLSASGSHRWTQCPGSVKAEEGFPDTSSPFAQEGTNAHELAELVLTQGGSAFDWEGKPLIENNAYTVEREMCGYIQEFVDYVKALGGDQQYEQRVDFSDWVENGFGTADVTAYVAETETLHVVDLKYGKGDPVTAVNNTQGLLYGLGYYSDLSMIVPIKTVVIHIHQPRRDHVDEWELTVDELLRWGEWLKDRAQACLDDDAERVPGESQCKYCKAKATCPALHRHTQKLMMSEFDAFEPVNIDALTDAQLKDVLDNKKLILGWLDAVESYVSDKLHNGESFEGYKLVEGRSLRQWADDQQAEATLSSLLGESAYTKKMISPAQAEKALGKADAKKLQDLIVKPAGKPTIAPADDKRPALTITANDFDFND